MSVTTANARVETSSYLHIQIPPGISPFQLQGGLGTTLAMMIMMTIVSYSHSAIPVGITTCLAVCEYFNTLMVMMTMTSPFHLTAILCTTCLKTMMMMMTMIIPLFSLQ